MLVKRTIELILGKKIVDILVFRSKFGFFILKFTTFCLFTVKISVYMSKFGFFMLKNSFEGLNVGKKYN